MTPSSAAGSTRCSGPTTTSAGPLDVPPAPAPAASITAPAALTAADAWEPAAAATVDGTRGLLAEADRVIGSNADEGLAAFLEELVENHAVEPL